MNENGELTNHVDIFRSHWKGSDICPDPSAYLVEDSDWIKMLGFSDDNSPNLLFRHYLFIGDDYSVEVIAKSLEWEVVLSDANAHTAKSLI